MVDRENPRSINRAGIRVWRKGWTGKTMFAVFCVLTLVNIFKSTTIMQESDVVKIIEQNYGQPLEMLKTQVDSLSRQTSSIFDGIYAQQPDVVYPSCTPKDDHRDRPEDISEEQFNKVREGEQIVAFIVTELHKYNVPVTLLFGTALHEYRNGTGNCIHPYFKEDDFDMGVFQEHFHYIVLMIPEIEKRFGWEVQYGCHPRWRDNMLVILPPGQTRKRGFQIDIYGFKANQPRDGLIDFEWDDVRVDSNAFLPLLKYKSVLTSNENATDDSIPHFYMPFNLPCYLANLYGADFMTPKRGFKMKQNVIPCVDHSDRFGNPPCSRWLTVPQKDELGRQLGFLYQHYEFKAIADMFWYDFAPYNKTICHSDPSPSKKKKTECDKENKLKKFWWPF